MRTWLAPILPCLLLLLLDVSCAAQKNVRSVPLSPPPALKASSSDFSQSGIASWYGADFHGKTTANGEIYDMYKLTAAHQTLPFNALVEVENLENGKKVLVRINDRGPFLKDRIIDLSLLAAQRLGMTGKGTAAVNIRVVRPSAATGPTEDATTADAGPECCVQFGAFASRENAEDLLLTLAEIFPGLRVRVINEDGMFKVLSENLTAIARCQEILAKLGDYHLQGFIRRP